jgi:hypothetical protein
MAQLTECGLLRGSFIPPGEIAAIRELTRYRKKLIEARTSELQRLGKVLEDCEIKIGSVASTLTTLSARETGLVGGLCPGNNESAGRHRSGRTCKGSEVLRAVLVECAWAGGRTNTYVGPSSATSTVASARREAPRRPSPPHTLIVIIWHVLANTTAYRELGSDYFTTRIDNPDARKRRLVRELGKSGPAVGGGEREL